MAKQTINIGSSANRGDGDPLRTAFDKVNKNFTELYSTLGISEIDVENFATKQYIDDAVKEIDISQLTDTQGLLMTDYEGGAASTVFNDDAVIDGGAASTVFDNNLTINGGGA